MEKITTEEFMDNLDMLQSRSGQIDEFGWWYLEGISADVGKKVYLNGYQRIMPSSRSSFEVSGAGTSVNELTRRSDMDNIAYNFTLSYGTC